MSTFEDLGFRGRLAGASARLERSQLLVVFLVIFASVIAAGAGYWAMSSFNLFRPDQKDSSEVSIPEDRYDYLSVPGFDISIAVDSEMEQVRLKPESINLGRFSEILSILGFTQGRSLVGFNIQERLNPTKVAIVFRDLTTLTDSAKDNLVITSTSDGLLVSGYDSDYNQNKPEELIYYLYLHPDLFENRNPEITEVNVSRNIAGTLFYAMYSGTEKQNQEEFLSFLDESFPQNIAKPPLVTLL